MSATELSQASSQATPSTTHVRLDGGQQNSPDGFRGAHTPTKSSVVSARHAWYPPVKFGVEYAAAVVLFLASLPFIAVAAVLIKLTSRGPVFYLQTRLGKDGQRFRVIKLRTMVNNAEAKTGAVWSTQNDPRITPVGRLLRETHIDEFPQLINVLLGHMALIGPRPERPEIVEQLEWQLPRYRQRLNVRPGITGLAQLKLPPDSNLESVRRKLLHDLYYIRYVSPWLDGKIFMVTGWVLTKTLIKGTFPFARLPNSDRVHDCIESLLNTEANTQEVTSEGDHAGEVTVGTA